MKLFTITLFLAVLAFTYADSYPELTEAQVIEFLENCPTDSEGVLRNGKEACCGYLGKLYFRKYSKTGWTCNNIDAWKDVAIYQLNQNHTLENVWSVGKRMLCLDCAFVYIERLDTLCNKNEEREKCILFMRYGGRLGYFMENNAKLLCWQSEFQKQLKNLANILNSKNLFPYKIIVPSTGNKKDDCLKTALSIQGE